MEEKRGGMNVLSIGDRVAINTLSCAVQPGGIDPKSLLGKRATIIWTKTFEEPYMQGICALVDDDYELISAWSYYTGKEFERVKG